MPRSTAVNMSDILYLMENVIESLVKCGHLRVKKTQS